MDSRLDHLFQEWQHLGGAVLVAESRDLPSIRSPEEVVAESTAYCRDSSRLLWVVVDWLIHHIEHLNEQLLLQETMKQGDLSVLGLICDIAKIRKNHPKFEQLMAHCRPQPNLEPFFHRVARSPYATRLAQENSLAVFRKWNYWCQELRYL
jgi:hypothetical protein